MEPISESRIISGFQNADSDVLKFLYQEYLPSVIHMVKSNNGAAIDAEDLFQDALVIIFEKIRLPGFSLKCTFKTYLYAICRNLWLHRLEKMNKEFIPYEFMENNLVSYYDPESFHTDADKDRLFHLHFLRLGANCQKILMLFFKRYSTSEIARNLGFKSEIYVRKRKSQCRKTLIKNIMKDPLYKKIQNQ